MESTTITHDSAALWQWTWNAIDGLQPTMTNAEREESEAWQLLSELSAAMHDGSDGSDSEAQ